MKKNYVKKGIGALVALIGLYMIFTYAGKAMPPTISGVGFLLLGANHLF